MLKPIINYMNLILIRRTKFFDFLMGKCEFIVKNDVEFPAQFYNQNWQSARNFDKYNGFGYWRLTGNVTMSTETSTGRANKLQYAQAYPLRFICAIPYKKFEMNDAYREDRLAVEIIKNITGNQPKLRHFLNAQSVTIQATNIITDRAQILTDERQETKIRYEMALLAIDVEAEVVINADCMKDVCESGVLGDFDVLDFNPKDFNVNFNF